jgi:hypothetical protein
LQKLLSYGGRNLIMEKGGVFGVWSKLVLKDILIYQNKCFWHRNRKMNLFLRKQTKWWQKWSKYAKSYDNFFGLQFDINLLFLALWDMLGQYELPFDVLA